MSRSKQIGTKAETAVVRVLREFWPNTERRALKGALDIGDIVNAGRGIVWEVKGGDAARGAGDGQIETWLDETERERSNARADLGVLVVQRKSIGLANAGRWWAIIRGRTAAGSPMTMRYYLREYARMLHEAGF